MKPLLLVVDDDIDDIEFVEDAIAQIPNAPDLKTFLNAEELLIFFSEMNGNPLPPLVIALDINLPRMNGIELLTLLKKDKNLSHIPISMVTTSSSILHKEECIKNGALHYFTKPIKLDDWIKIIQTLLYDIDGNNALPNNLADNNGFVS
jgi:CheY-like chemotaxis protein